jgi:hypothetical protein
VAASEGFLVAEKRRGLFRHAVVWGEMVCLPFFFFFFAAIDCVGKKWRLTLEIRIQW